MTPQPNVCLSDAELAQITGYVMPSLQIRWLTDNGWVHAISGAKRPLVSRRYAEARIEGRTETISTEPDFAALT